MAEMDMTDLVEYNIYLTGWDSKLVSLGRMAKANTKRELFSYYLLTMFCSEEEVNSIFSRSTVIVFLTCSQA